MTQAAPARNIRFAPIPQPREGAAKPPPQFKPTLVVRPEEITTGSVLLKKGTSLPVVLRTNARRFGDWEMVSELDGFGVERELRQSGWHFFFLVPAITAASIALDRQRARAKAIRRITQAVDASGFNAVEITAIEQKSWLGIHYVSITAHPRHVRNSPFIRDLDPHHYPKGLWDFKRIFDVRNRQGAPDKGHVGRRTLGQEIN